MTTAHHIKLNDTPTKQWALDRDITGATVRAIVTTSDQERTVVIDRAATIVTAVEGIVSLEILAADFTEEGTYYIEFETDTGGVILTHPDNSYGRIHVHADLG